MDPVEEMLINKYGIDPKDAYNMALDIRHGGERTGNAGDETNRLVKQEAYTDVANAQTNMLNRMAANAKAFTAMHEAVGRGEALNPKDEEWYQLVLNKHRQRIKDTAHLRTSQMNALAMSGAHSSKVRGNLIARAAMESLDNVNRGVDNAMATEQTRRDQIANQLIPQPQNVMPPVQMPVQQDFPQYTPQGSNMDPMIAAYIQRMQGGH